MRPIIDPHESPRTKLARRALGAAAVVLVLSTAMFGSRFGWWQWAAGGYLALMVCAAMIFVPALGYRHRGGGTGKGTGRGGALSWRGRDDAGPAGHAAHQWRTLLMVSRMMPGSAGRRWLAEAESLLAEIAAAQRGAAFRSYLLSAPRLVPMMWAREILRRARLGPRRPG